MKISYSIKNFLKTIIGSVALLPFSIFNLLKNINKIQKSEVIILHFGDGYGDHFTHHDIMRYYFKAKKTLYIHFFETERHNVELSNIFTDNSFYFKNNFKISLFKKVLTFGEFERSIFKPLNCLLFFLIKIFKKKKTKIYFYPYLYNKINFTYKKFKISTNLYNPEIPNLKKDWLIYYYRIVEKYKKNYGYKLRSPLTKYNEIKTESKICCMYLRGKKFNSQNFSSTRSGSSNIDTYLPTINFLLESGYNIFLLGDRFFQIQNIKNKPKFININLIKKKKLKDKVEIFALLNSDLFISENGGLSYFGLYSKKMLLINYFPSNYPFPATKLVKKIYDKSNDKFINLENMSNFEQFEILKRDENMELKNNTSSEILNFVKKNI